MSRRRSDSGSLDGDMTFGSRSTTSLSLDDLMSQSYEKASTSTFQSQQQRQQQQYQQNQQPRFVPPQTPIAGNVAHQRPVIRQARYDSNNFPNHAQNDISGEIMEDDEISYDGNAQTVVSNLSTPTWITNTTRSQESPALRSRATIASSLTSPRGLGGSKASGSSSAWGNPQLPASPSQVQPRPAKEYHFNPGDLRRGSMGIPEHQHETGSDVGDGVGRGSREYSVNFAPNLPTRATNSPRSRHSHSQADDDDSGSVFEDEFLMEESQSNLSGSDHQGSTHNPHEELAQTETRQIGWLRVGVLCVLLFATALVSFAIFYNTRWAEMEYFQGQFEDYSSHIMDRCSIQLQHTVNAMEHLGELYTSTGATPRQQEENPRGRFPFVSLPHFEIRGDSVRQELSHGMNWIGFVPIIPNDDDTRLSWEEYSRRESYWIQDGLRQQFVASSATSRNGGTNSQTASDRNDDNVFTGGQQRKRLLFGRHLQKEELAIDKGSGDVDDSPPDVDENRAGDPLPTPTPTVISDPELDSVGPDDAKFGDDNNKTGDSPSENNENNADVGSPAEGDENDKDGGDSLADGDSISPGESNGGAPSESNGGKKADGDMENGSEFIVKPIVPGEGNVGAPFPTLSTPFPPQPTLSPVSNSLPPVAPFPMPLEGEPVEVSNDGVSGRIYYLQPRQGSSSTEWERVVQPMQGDENGYYYAPVWQCSPVIPSLVNYNLRSHPIVGPELKASVTTRDVVIGKVLTTTDVEGGGTAANAAADTRIYETDPLVYLLNPTVSESSSQVDDPGPRSKLFVPVVVGSSSSSSSSNGSESAGGVVAGVVTAVVVWRDYLQGLLPYKASVSSFSGTTKVIAILENECGQQFSYQLVGQGVEYLGIGDFHDGRYDHLGAQIDFSTLLSTTATARDIADHQDPTALNNEICPFSLRLYPTKEMYDSYRTWKPLIYTVGVVVTFLFTAAVFGSYDYLVERRQRLVLDTALKSSAVVSSLFPAVVRDRLFSGGDSRNGSVDGSVDDDDVRSDSPGMYRASSMLSLKPKTSKSAASAKRRIKSFLDDSKDGRPGNSKDIGFGSKPIADLFPYCTVMFGDISGFTAWSSVREPSQVFTLLESIYKSFDATAKKRSVFKVETIGDCYVAVTGLPDPQEDHAIIMAKFAYECKHKMNNLTQVLERELGPDTGDLKMRFGLHSGPVTAGVLRGEKSRFQLFGDTVNTASRMESTGKPDNIHCSQATADLLIAAGKNHWLQARDEVVQAKGKGEIQTYWIDPRFKHSEPVDSFKQTKSKKRLLPRDVGISTRSLVWGDSKSFVELPSPLEAHKHQRLIDWNVELLGRLLKQIIVRRQRSKDQSRRTLETQMPNYQKKIGNPIDEVTEAITMPQFDVKSVSKSADPDSIDLGSSVMTQLKSFVTTIACLYHDENPFHNYEHASHVCLSANKLLKRVVQPDDVYDRKGSTKTLASNLHQYTYGITSDPLTQFAVVFSALIHDVDHNGVSNMQLIKEKTSQAIKYKNKSVAEQNSVDLSWNLLMEGSYAELRKTIYSNETEFKRFRSLVVNSVIATDIFDPDLKTLRNNRWERAFYQGDNDTNLKATIVIEHIIQAADVSHTMQHWHVYQKWNERLFQEMYAAYRSGRGGDKDPSLGWFKGELWFYDNYVIPLAKKLKECGVFGVASAECLTYAIDNRNEWEAKGEAIVERMVRDHGPPKF